MNHDAPNTTAPGRIPSLETVPADRTAAPPPPGPEPAETKATTTLDPAAIHTRTQELLRQKYPTPPPALGDPAPANKPSPGPIPARMLNEFVYCPRLFHYEFIEGLFLQNADTLRGSTIHQRVDSGKGDLPKAATPPSPAETQATKPETAAVDPGEATETIHTRSVNLGSERLGVTAKLDLVEVRTTGDLFALEVCPVDYKVGSPRRGEDANELWDADKMQLGLQALILRDNGYTCTEGVIYYRATRQRVRLPITAELETWVLAQIDAARAVIARGIIPPPLENSPKCVRCSLAPICLPDETRLLAEAEATPKDKVTAPRRLIAARDDRRALYLNKPGLRIGRKDEVLQVKEEKTLIDEVRINDVNHIALFGNIQISTQAIQSLCEAEVPVTYFSMGGWFYGLTRGHELKNVFLRMEQFRLARDPLVCLDLARRFVQGKIRNHRTLLMRNHLEPPAPVLARLKQALQDVLKATSLEELLGMEGAAAAVYFEQFSGMLKYEDARTEDKPTSSQLTFNFNHRNRRPPTDPINAMLSLAYSLLSKDCTIAVLAVGFDPYVGFYHQPRFGRPALALDIMEEFRPLIAESVVLTCVNGKIVTEADFVRAGEAVNLSPAGRKRFFQAYEQRMSSLLTHPVFDYKVSYRRALELQARLLAKSLTGEIPEYVPLTTR